MKKIRLILLLAVFLNAIACYGRNYTDCVSLLSVDKIREICAGIEVNENNVRSQIRQWKKDCVDVEEFDVIVMQYYGSAGIIRNWCLDNEIRDWRSEMDEEQLKYCGGEDDWRDGMTKAECKERVETLAYLDSLTDEEKEEVGKAQSVIINDMARAANFRLKRSTARLESGIKKDREEFEAFLEKEKQRIVAESKQRSCETAKNIYDKSGALVFWQVYSHPSMKEAFEDIKECDWYKEL